jgi:hypothetical protein
MDRDSAFRKYKALLNMTEARGCSEAEASSAAALAKQLAGKWNFAHEPAPDAAAWTDRVWQPKYEKASQTFHWEYRKCGKPACWCRHAKYSHGPYRYHKKRIGKKVVSVYLGK